MPIDEVDHVAATEQIAHAPLDGAAHAADRGRTIVGQPQRAGKPGHFLDLDFENCRTGTRAAAQATPYAADTALLLQQTQVGVEHRDVQGYADTTAQACRNVSGGQGLRAADLDVLEEAFEDSDFDDTPRDIWSGKVARLVK